MSDIELIDVHLGARQKKNKDGSVCSKEEFFDWRYRTLQARAGLLAARRAVDKVIGDRKYHLAYPLVQRLLSIALTVDEEDLSDDELRAIQEAKLFIERN